MLLAFESLGLVHFLRIVLRAAHKLHISCRCHHVCPKMCGCWFGVGGGGGSELGFEVVLDVVGDF